MIPQERFEQWYQSLKLYAGGFPARGSIGGALVVLERLKSDLNLSIDAHTAEGGSQIAGASGAAVKQILLRFDETRPFVSEGGRTNRGLRRDIINMLQAIVAAGLQDMSIEDRNNTLENFQLFLVSKIRDFHNKQRLKFVYDASKSTRQTIQDLLAVARETAKEGPVAQYLIGAKLQLRFPEYQIGNESYSTADIQLSRQGDFLVGNTVFHVTVSPMPAVYEKCKRNLENGFRVYLLVPDKVVIGARQNAETIASGQIAVESIESFIGQNVEELSGFSNKQLTQEFRRLLETYNQRVDVAELDKSMLIEVPVSLSR